MRQQNGLFCACSPGQVFKVQHDASTEAQPAMRGQDSDTGQRSCIAIYRQPAGSHGVFSIESKGVDGSVIQAVLIQIRRDALLYNKDLVPDGLSLL